MRHIAESSSQSLSSRFGSISGYRSKVFLSPACGGVESSAVPIMESSRLSEGLLHCDDCLINSKRGSSCQGSETEEGVH